jgi:UDP-glucose 4-epimerase
MNILVTGGSGYIGSHTCLELIRIGHKVIVIDNLSNSSIKSLKTLEDMTKSDIPFYKLDLRDREKVSKVFERHNIDGVIHFAGLKSVNESIDNPLYYYDNNISSVFAIIEIMKKFDCKTFVFSSSATVYGDPHKLPIREDFPLYGTNPYGRSKIVIEGFLEDLITSDKSWRIAILRYFNPVGADSGGLIGEDPMNIPNNLMPYISQVAIGKIKKLKIFGGDYKTPDGTGIRDYIHVVDLAKGHIKALDYLNRYRTILVANLGTGRGYSVLDVVKTFESVSGKNIPYEIIDRRPGDVAICYADCSYAEEKLNWKAKYNLNRMCKDSWFWQSKNPSGYN